MQKAKIPKHWKSYLNFTGSYKKKSVKLPQPKLKLKLWLILKIIKLIYLARSRGACALKSSIKQLKVPMDIQTCHGCGYLIFHDDNLKILQP